MRGYALTLEEFAVLAQASSRHHLKQLAGWMSLTAHTRKGLVYFKDRDGREVPLAEVHRACEANARTRRWAYNLYMHYAHFG